jgi:hypothetical protein
MACVDELVKSHVNINSPYSYTIHTKAAIQYIKPVTLTSIFCVVFGRRGYRGLS